MHKRTVSDKFLVCMAYAFSLLLVTFIVVPIWLLLVDSFSTTRFYMMRGLHWWPNPISLEAYQTVLAKSSFAIAYRNTAVRTVVVTLFGTILTLMGGYALSKDYLIGRKPLTAIIVFTMYFSGGMIPSYINIRQLGLLNSFWVYIFPGLVSAYNLIVMRNFMFSIPSSLEESAMIDGANEFQILLKIVAPLSKPILATIALWICIANWNAWFDAMIYTSSPNLVVLQLLIRNIILESEIFESADTAEAIHVTSGTLRAASIFVAIGPIVVVYPFLQKHFVKGVMIGAVKQ